MVIFCKIAYKRDIQYVHLISRLTVILFIIHFNREVHNNQKQIELVHQNSYFIGYISRTKTPLYGSNFHYCNGQCYELLFFVGR